MCNDSPRDVIRMQIGSFCICSSVDTSDSHLSLFIVLVVDM